MPPQQTGPDRTWIDRLVEQIGTNSHAMPLGQTLGYRLTQVTRGQATVEIDTEEKHFNFSGYAHGGVLCTIMDTAMGLAALTTLEPDETATTVELKVNMLRPVWRSHLRAIAKVTNSGRTLQLLECDVLDERDKLIAKAMGTWMTLRGEHAEKRRNP